MESSLLLLLSLIVVNDAMITTFKNELLPYEEFLKIKKEDAPCPCSNASLCDNVKTIHQRELFGFAGPYGSNISLYNWTYLTTIAWAPTNNAELMCYAHQNNVRLIAATSNIPFTDNATERETSIKQKFEQI